MRVYCRGSVVVGLVVAAEAALVGAMGPGSYELPLGLLTYGWLMLSFVELVLRLRRGQNPWLPLAFVAYGITDSLYGLYLVQVQPDPSHLTFPAWVLAAHGLFGVAFAWGSWRTARGGKPA